MFLNIEYSLRLSDVSTKERKAAYKRFYFAWESAFRTSRLFSRGSNVQKLLAPAVVTFFSKEVTLLGDKSRSERQIHQITRIPVLALRRPSLQDSSIEERILWTEKRQITHKEDEVYSLLGTSNTSMSPMYGEEKESAFRRLRKRIHPSPHRGHDKSLMESLGFHQTYTCLTTIRNAHSETCTWVSNTSKYFDWLDTDKLRQHHGFLCIKGKSRY